MSYPSWRPVPSISPTPRRPGLRKPRGSYSKDCRTFWCRSRTYTNLLMWASLHKLNLVFYNYLIHVKLTDLVVIYILLGTLLMKWLTAQMVTNLLFRFFFWMKLFQNLTTETLMLFLGLPCSYWSHKKKLMFFGGRRP